MLIAFEHGGNSQATAGLGECIVRSQLDSMGILYTVRSEMPLQIILDDYYYAVFALQWISDSPCKRYKVLSQY